MSGHLSGLDRAMNRYIFRGDGDLLADLGVAATWAKAVPRQGFASGQPGRSMILVHVPRKALLVWKNGAVIRVAAWWVCGGQTNKARLEPVLGSTRTTWKQCPKCAALAGAA